MIALKQAKSAGNAGASIHSGLTPSHDTLALMLPSAWSLSPSHSLSNITIPSVLYSIRFSLCC